MTAEEARELMREAHRQYEASHQTFIDCILATVEKEIRQAAEDGYSITNVNLNAEKDIFFPVSVPRWRLYREIDRTNARFDERMDAVRRILTRRGFKDVTYWNFDNRPTLIVRW